MKILKIALAAAAIALMTSPAWALPGHTPSNPGTGHAPSTVPVGPPSTVPVGPPTTTPGAEHAPSTVPVGPPSTTPNDSENPGSANRSSNGQGHAGGGEHGGKQNRSHNDAGNGGSNPGAGHRPTGKPPHPSQSRRCTPHNVAYIAAGTLLKQTLSKDGTANTYSGELEVAVKRTNRHAAADRDTTKTYKVEHIHVTFALADVNNDGGVGLDDVQVNDRVKLIGKITVLAKRCDQSGFTATLTIAHIVLHPPATSPVSPERAPG